MSENSPEASNRWTDYEIQIVIRLVKSGYSSKKIVEYFNQDPKCRKVCLPTIKAKRSELIKKKLL